MSCAGCGHENRAGRKFRAAERRRVRLYLSLINWGEVMYIVRREKGEVAGHEVAARIDAWPITLRADPRFTELLTKVGLDK